MTDASNSEQHRQLPPLRQQSMSLFSKQGYLRRREANLQNTEITDVSHTMPTNYRVTDMQNDASPMISRKIPSFKENGDLKKQFKSGLKKVQKSQMMFYLRFVLMLVSASSYDVVVAGGRGRLSVLLGERVRSGPDNQPGHLHLPPADLRLRHHRPHLQGQGPLPLHHQALNRNNSLL